MTAEQVIDEPDKEAQARAAVPTAERCPICWGVHGGVGVEYAHDRQTRRRYYRCSKSIFKGGGRCGFTWGINTGSHYGNPNQ